MLVYYLEDANVRSKVLNRLLYLKSKHNYKHTKFKYT